MFKYASYNKEKNKYDNGRGELVDLDLAELRDNEIDLGVYDEPEEWKNVKLRIEVVSEMVSSQNWEEFRSTGLFWWVNMLLHTFGWALVLNVDKDNVLDAFPARVKFRGFDSNSNTEGYQKVSRFMVENAEILEKESLE